MFGSINAGDISAAAGIGGLLITAGVLAGRWQTKRAHEHSEDKLVDKAVQRAVFGTPAVIVNGRKIQEETAGLVKVVPQMQVLIDNNTKAIEGVLNRLESDEKRLPLPPPSSSRRRPSHG